MTGTAAAVGPIGTLEISGVIYDVPFDEKLKAGRLTHEIYNELLDIQYGVTPHPFSMRVV